MKKRTLLLLGCAAALSLTGCGTQKEAAATTSRSS